VLRGKERPDEGRRRRLACLPQRQDGPDRRVDELSGPVGSQAREQVVGPVTCRGACHRDERDVGCARRLLPGQVVGRSAGLGAGGDEAERRPGGDLSVTEAAVGALLLLDVRRRSRKGGRRR
jgi:hypothetical protein